MTNPEHLLTIVEPTTGGDGTLRLARETVARGGSASVVMVITDRVQRNISDFAASENLGRYEAESQAIDQLRAQCNEEVGGVSRLETHYGRIGSEVVRYVTSDTTAIAVPARLIADGVVERLAEYSGRPVIVTPTRAAVA